MRNLWKLLKKDIQTVCNPKLNTFKDCVDYIHVLEKMIWLAIFVNMIVLLTILVLLAY